MGPLARDKLNSSQVCGEYHGASRPDAEVQASEQLHAQRKAYTSKGGARPQRSNHANKGKAALESHYSINKGPKFGHEELQSALAKIGKKGAPPRLSGAETSGLQSAQQGSKFMASSSQKNKSQLYMKNLTLKHKRDGDQASLDVSREASRGLKRQISLGRA